MVCKLPNNFNKKRESKKYERENERVKFSCIKNTTPVIRKEKYGYGKRRWLDLLLKTNNDI